MKQTLMALVLLISFAFFGALPATAQAPTAPSSYPNLFSRNTSGYFIHPNCTGQSNSVKTCGINELLQTVVNISQFILGILGSVTLLMFVYGGVVWLTSAGNTDRVQKGKNIFIATLVGLAIIFSSSLIINFVVAALSGQTPGDDVRLFQGAGETVPQGEPGTIPTAPRP